MLRAPERYKQRDRQHLGIEALQTQKYYAFFMLKTLAPTLERTDSIVSLGVAVGIGGLVDPASLDGG